MEPERLNERRARLADFGRIALALALLALLAAFST
jgi:hypothetical protein